MFLSLNIFKNLTLLLIIYNILLYIYNIFVEILYLLHENFQFHFVFLFILF